MGCCSSINFSSKINISIPPNTCNPSANLAAIKSSEIEEELNNLQKYLKHEIKLLLLGAAEVGKSTILKQIKFIHNEDCYNEEDRLAFKSLVHFNAIHSLITIVHAMDYLTMEYETKNNRKKASNFVSYVKEWDGHILSPSLANQMMVLWVDKGVQECFRRSNEYHLNDSAAYFLDSMGRISAINYIPTMQDVLRTRIETKGVVEVKFQYQEMNFHMIDVGGNRLERKKWIHIFDNVKAVIFLAALSDYDLVLSEDRERNRMVETLGLFESICNNQCFNKTSMILFLNKLDVFSMKIRDPNCHPLTICFQHFSGNLHSIPDACEFIKEEFERSKHNTKKQVFTHFTCATDTEQIRSIFIVITDMLIKEMIELCGLY